jgi:hypothetical protein
VEFVIGFCYQVPWAATRRMALRGVVPDPCAVPPGIARGAGRGVAGIDVNG